LHSPTHSGLELRLSDVQMQPTSSQNRLPVHPVVVVLTPSYGHVLAVQVFLGRQMLLPSSRSMPNWQLHWPQLAQIPRQGPIEVMAGHGLLAQSDCASPASTKRARRSARTVWVSMAPRTPRVPRAGLDDERSLQCNDRVASMCTIDQPRRVGWGTSENRAAAQQSNVQSRHLLSRAC
jgi:hypothetical protein